MAILLANPFETPLSSGYVKVKLNFYLGPYVLYFFIWFMLLISLDIFEVYKSGMLLVTQYIIYTYTFMVSLSCKYTTKIVI